MHCLLGFTSSDLQVSIFPVSPLFFLPASTLESHIIMIITFCFPLFYGRPGLVIHTACGSPLSLSHPTYFLFLPFSFSPSSSVSYYHDHNVLLFNILSVFRLGHTYCLWFTSFILRAFTFPISSPLLFLLLFFSLRSLLLNPLTRDHSPPKPEIPSLLYGLYYIVALKWSFKSQPIHYTVFSGVWEVNYTQVACHGIGVVAWNIMY